MTNELTQEERERYEIVAACSAGTLTNAEAAARVQVSVRQIRRLKRAVETLGTAGIQHAGRGKVSNRKTSETTTDAVVAHLRKKESQGFGPTFAQEQLEKEGIADLAVETVRGIMRQYDLWKPRGRRTREVRREWRERRALPGELVQFDGSYHRWLEDRAGEGCVLASIDDANNRVVAVFEENEGVYAVFRFWQAYFETYGLPVAIYLDKFSTYKVNHKNAVDNADLMTQFERAMIELDITVICANSPQAKGRVERLFGTLQDRLVKELRLAGISSYEEACRFLTRTYVPDHNKRFMVIARARGDAHRPLSEATLERLPSILSIRSERVVNNDFTVRFKNRWLQLTASQETTVFRKDVVTIEERLDGTLHVLLRGIPLAYTSLPERPQRQHTKVTALTKQQTPTVPHPEHPWRKSFK